MGSATERDDDYEIERKYLLRALPVLPAGTRLLEIDQGWIPGTRLKERLRRTREGDRTTYYRTVKLGSGLKRLEIEEETTATVFDTLWSLTAGKRIHKLRHVVEDHGTWEIDQFLDFDLFLAEIELDREDEIVVMPQWLEAVLVKEVTGDVAYTNYSMAR